MKRIRVSAAQRREIFRRASGCCEYCKSPAEFATGSFSVEHIFPQALGGTSTLDNLALSCEGCNGHKGVKTEGRDPVSGEVVSLFHARKQRWEDHFTWAEDPTTIIGITPTGRATVEELRLNRAGLVNLRRVLYTVGVHPRE